MLLENCSADKEYIEKFTEGYKLSRKIIIKDLSYFYSLEFLEEIMRQQIPFHGYINNLNLNYEKIKFDDPPKMICTPLTFVQ